MPNLNARTRRILSKIPWRGCDSRTLARILNEDVPGWKFWRLWTRLGAHYMLLSLEDDGWVESHFSHWPHRIRVFRKTHKAVVALMEDEKCTTCQEKAG